MIHPRTQALIDLHTRRPARLNPSRGIAASRAAASSPRSCSPTDQPYAPARTYHCASAKCGASVVLAPTSPLPDDWQTVVIAAQRGRAERTGHRCPKCARRSLVFELLADDIALHAIAIADARRLAAWCESQGLDGRGIRIVIRRMKTQHGAEAWARFQAAMESLELGVDDGQ